MSIAAIYTLLSGTLGCLVPQVELLRRHSSDALRIVVTQGPGRKRAPAELAARLNVETLLLELDQVSAPQTMLVSRRLQILAAVLRAIATQPETKALIVHGDLLPTKSFAIDELLAGRGLAGTGGERQGILGSAMIAIDKSRVDPAQLAHEIGRRRIGDIKFWPARNLAEHELGGRLGASALTSDAHVAPREWIEPCWLHLGGMSAHPEQIGPKLARVVDALRIAYEPLPDEDFSEPEAAPLRGAPSLRAKAQNLGVGMASWLAAGRPKRSSERIAEIFDSLCRPCPHFAASSDAQGSCKLCGCALRRQGGLLNKISMATESCPARPPRWIAEGDVA